MSDLTLLYYTANLISDFFASNIIEHLLRITNGVPIVSISHKPMVLGKNICVGDIGISSWNIYYQILLGAKEAATKYVACCEDDSLYVPEHFEYRPKEDEFAYNVHRWNVNPMSYFYKRNRPGMCMCIAPTDLMVKTLETRFEKYTKEEYSGIEKIPFFGEPGRYEIMLGLPVVKRVHFTTELPTLTFNHRPSYGGVRRLLPTDTVKEELPHWGRASDLWKGIYG